MRYNIHNPFVSGQDYHCFACAPHNPIGLRLQFERDDDVVRAHWEPARDYQGYSNIVHGGIQATLLDEVASWTIFVLCGVAGVTQSMRTDYARALPIDAGRITAVGRVSEQSARTVTIAAELCVAETAYTRATAVFRIIPQRMAQRTFGFPDPQSFHPPRP